MDVQILGHFLDSREQPQVTFDAHETDGKLSNAEVLAFLVPEKPLVVQRLGVPLEHLDGVIVTVVDVELHLRASALVRREVEKILQKDGVWGYGHEMRESFASSNFSSGIDIKLLHICMASLYFMIEFELPIAVVRHQASASQPAHVHIANRLNIL